MKLKFGIKILFFLAIIQNSEIILAAPPTIPSCVGDPITDSTGVCSSTPEVYRMHIFKMGLCNGIGPDLDSGSVPDITSKCITTFDSGLSSVSVDIRDNVSDPVVGGTITRPPNDTYYFGFVLIENRAEIKAVKTFLASKDGQDGGSGPVCWTVNADARVGLTTKCGASLDSSSYGFVSNYWDNLDIDPANPVFFSPYTEGDLDPTYAYLMNGEVIATPGGPVNRMLGFARFISPKSVNDSTSAMEVLFRVKRGLSVNQTADMLGKIGFYSYEFKTITNLR